jgi:ubiquinone/menaquinone biosynthesis C-methylase UbiE
MFRIVWNKLINKIFHSKKHKNLTDYWRDRAKRHGKHSVLNIAHREDEFESVTDYQKKFLFPHLKSKLTGTESTALDFGCGPGRFTVDLAELIGGTVVGVDITPELIEIAQKSSLVSYRCIGTQTLPFPDASFDLVWSCLVLGGIPDNQIIKTIHEINRVLKPGGLFFYVENTANTVSSDYWFFRDEETYIKMAAFCNPQKLAE